MTKKKCVQMCTVPNEDAQASLPLPRCNYAPIHLCINPFIHQSIPSGSKFADQVAEAA